MKRFRIYQNLTVELEREWDVHAETEEEAIQKVEELEVPMLSEDVVNVIDSAPYRGAERDPKRGWIPLEDEE